MFFQWCVPWTVARMVFVPKVCVDVTMAGQVPCVINDHVIHDAMIMDNVRTAPAYVRKDGMANIVPYVSYSRVKYCFIT